MLPPFLKNALLLTILVCSASSAIFSQKIAFNDVLQIRLQDMGPIYQNNQVKGYYMFYYVDKEDNKHLNYKLVVLDADLNVVIDKKMTEEKSISLQEAGYDEKSLFFVFYESKLKKLEFRRYDMEGKLLNKKSEVLTRRESYFYQGAVATTGAMVGNHLNPVVDKGFLHYAPQKNKKLGYSIRFFAEDGGKDWKHESDEESKEIESASFLGYNNNMVLSSVIKKGGSMSKDLDFYLQGINMVTGKVVFEKSLDDKQYAIQLLNAFPDQSDDAKIIVTGLYFDVDDKLAKAKSLGLFTGIMNEKGEFTTKNYISWAKDVSKLLPVNAKGKVEGGGYIYFHKTERMNDGKIFAVGEMYGKAASALGIASTVAAGLLGGSSNASVVNIEVRDMIVFEFNPDLSLADVAIFDKKSSTTELPSGAEATSTQLLGTLVDYYGGFDFMYAQTNEDHSILSFCYDNYERSKGKRKHVLGIVSHRVGEADYTTDKVNLSTEASTIRSFPAKPGYVLLFEYYKKKKTLDLHIEKFNN